MHWSSFPGRLYFWVVQKTFAFLVPPPPAQDNISAPTNTMEIHEVVKLLELEEENCGCSWLLNQVSGQDDTSGCFFLINVRTRVSCAGKVDASLVVLFYKDSESLNILVLVVE